MPKERPQKKSKQHRETCQQGIVQTTLLLFTRTWALIRPFVLNSTEYALTVVATHLCNVDYVCFVSEH